ncbi:hypothetical protein Plhal710r2_c031g0115691 [Plasmopara halstedii]
MALITRTRSRSKKLACILAICVLTLKSFLSWLCDVMLLGQPVMNMIIK